VLVSVLVPALGLGLAWEPVLALVWVPALVPEQEPVPVPVLGLGLGPVLHIQTLQPPSSLPATLRLLLTIPVSFFFLLL